jgi:multimeric flavodoxin WrbA
MKKKILILKSSARTNGNSTTLANQIQEGACEAGTDVESINLHGMNIQPCRGCFLCYKSDKGCVIDDDMQVLFPKIRQADALVLASPIYWYNICGLLKLFLDRFIAFSTDRGGYELRGKRIGVALSYGAGDIISSGANNAINALESMFRYIGSDLVEIVHGSGNNPGDIAHNKILMDQAFRLGKNLANPSP